MGDYGAPTLKPTVCPGSMEIVLNALAMYHNVGIVGKGDVQPIMYIHLRYQILESQAMCHFGVVE